MRILQQGLVVSRFGCVTWDHNQGLTDIPCLQPIDAIYFVFNPFTLRVSLKSIVCYSHTFESNLGIKQRFTKKLMKNCCLASD